MFSEIPDNSVDLILCDPPYGTVKGLDIKGWVEHLNQWDDALNTEKMFDECNRMLRFKGRLILFSQEPYTSHLRSYYHQYLRFNYSLIWLKNHFANYFSCRHAPVNLYEDLSVWTKEFCDTHKLRDYVKSLLEYVGMSNTMVEKDIGNRRATHFLAYDAIQFRLCNRRAYEELTEHYNLTEWSDYLSYDELLRINENEGTPVFNMNGRSVVRNVLKYDKPVKHYHPTQKPVPLLRDLVCTYSNEADTVLDFTMGSGSTGVACVETGRDFIGIELDEDFYQVAVERIGAAESQCKLSDYF